MASSHGSACIAHIDLVAVGFMLTLRFIDKKKEFPGIPRSSQESLGVPRNASDFLRIPRNCPGHVRNICGKNAQHAWEISRRFRHMSGQILGQRCPGFRGALQFSQRSAETALPLHALEAQ